MKIYLDNAATTQPIYGNILERHINEAWYNPSAAYGPAEDVFLEIKRTKQTLMDAVSFDGDCMMTSGGTEANNTVIMSAMKKNAHYITSEIEHPSVYAAFQCLEQQGADVDYIKPQGFCITVKDVLERVKSNTSLVSIMHVNNETGAVNDIGAICAAVKAKNKDTAFHSDGVQALFKTVVNLKGTGVDYYTVSAHKIHALKGTGALLFNKNKAPKAMLHGGAQENGLRPGTENTLGIQAFHEALARGCQTFEQTLNSIGTYSKKLADGLETIEDAVMNVPDSKVPHIVNVSFPGVRAEVLVRALGEKGIYVGTGAACSRGKLSRVLINSGMDKRRAEGAVRISISAMNTDQEIAICLEEIKNTVKQLRRFGRR